MASWRSIEVLSDDDGPSTPVKSARKSKAESPKVSRPAPSPATPKAKSKAKNEGKKPQLKRPAGASATTSPAKMKRPAAATVPAVEDHAAEPPIMKKPAANHKKTVRVSKYKYKDTGVWGIKVDGSQKLTAT